MPICKYSCCTKNAIYGYINKKAEYCSSHKKDNMNDVRHKKCIICNLFQSFLAYFHF